MSLRRLLPAFLLVPLGLIALPSTSAATTYSDGEQLTVTVQPRIGGLGRDQGKIPLQVAWNLDPGWGVAADGCFTPASFEGQVKVIAQGTTERVVATFAISSQTGSGTVKTPVNSAYRGVSYLVTADYTARRSKTAGCGNDPFGFDEVAERRLSVQVPVIYAGEDACDWKATVSSGYVRVKRRGGPTERLGRGDAAVAGDTIITGKRSKVEIRSGAGDVIRIGANSKLELRDVYCANRGQRRFHWKLWAGRIWTKVARLVGGRRSNYQVDTPGWAVGVRGTTFWVDARGKGRKAVVKVYTVKGKVELRNLKNPRRRVIVRAGHCSSARGTGAGRPKRPKRCRSVSAAAFAPGLGDPVETLRH